ncbi:MAG: VIT1/CCC1 transporter family protein [Sandaracinobacter sp.]
MALETFGEEVADHLSDPETHRTWSLAAQDGIISTAGILLGFSGAGVGPSTMLVAGTAAIVSGMLTAGGAQWSETAVQREAELAAIAVQRRELKAQPEVQRAELVAHYEEKGLDAALAAEVADALMERAPLRAALESEHGILELTTRAQVLLSGVGFSLAYGLGAAIPFAIAWYLPVDIELWVIVFTVLLSLALTSVVGARAGRMDLTRTLVRTLLVATVTIVVSYVVGALGAGG